MAKVLFILGTRPEAIKLCPVLLYMREHAPALQASLCVTAQHRDMLDEVLGIFGVSPDYDLNVMQPGQTLFQSTSRIMAGLEKVLADSRPDMVIVQGDTTTTFVGGLAAFYAGVPVAHVEAGLRTNDMRQPFPEEMNRVLVSRLTRLHFAATQRAHENLIAEGIPAGRVFVTGNSGIDAVLHVNDALVSGRLIPSPWPQLERSRRLLVVTAHRRENFGSGLEAICKALRELARRSDVQLAFPVHPNPNVGKVVGEYLGGMSNVVLLPPAGYVEFVDLMRRSFFLMTDSGGIQEEGPSLGKPVLVFREKTERPEAVEAGTVRLVGCDAKRIVDEAECLLDNPDEYIRRSRIHNPYGDGKASGRITAVVQDFLNQAG